MDPRLRGDDLFYAAATGTSLFTTCRFTALNTALNDAVTMLLSTPAPNKVGPLSRRSST